MARDSYQGIPTRSYNTAPYRGPIYGTVSRGFQRYYISETGNDSNSGLSLGEAKKTFTGVNAVMPDVFHHNAALHISGQIDIDTGVESDRFFMAGKVLGTNVKIMIDGGTDVVILDDNGGANYTATSNSTSSLTVAGAAWSTDEHIGRQAQILGGTNAGELVAVFGNTSDTLDLGKITVAHGDVDFRLVQPHTSISGSTVYSYTGFWGNVGGGGTVYCQNMRFVDNAYLFIFRTDTPFTLSNIFLQSQTGYSGVLSEATLSMASFEISLDDEGTATYDSSKHRFGLSVNSDFQLKIHNSPSVFFRHSYVKPTFLLKRIHADCQLGYGTVVDGLVTFTNNIGGRLLRDDGLNGHFARFRGGFFLGGCSWNSDTATPAMEFSNPAGHGLEISDSFVELGAITGNAVGGHGVFVHARSMVNLTAAPTISGTEGYLTFDGTTTTSGTWASIYAGGAVADLTTELSIVKVAP